MSYEKPKPKPQPQPDMSIMFQDITQYIETLTSTKPDETYAENIWKDEVEELFTEIDDTPAHTIKDALLEVIPSFYKKAKAQKESSQDGILKRKRQLTVLETTPQIVQRSAEWYKHMKEFLTASQLSDIFVPGRTRGKLVMSKVVCDDDAATPTNYRIATWSHEMTPFDWGIRFEPVAKMLYEYLTNTPVREIGRLIHKNPLLKLAASPDGIVEDSRDSRNTRIGRLVEFKAPISRSIEKGDIPKNYWQQMQIQMEVADVDSCDYFEIQLRSTKGNETVEGPCIKYGYVYTIGAVTPPYDDPQPVRYLYSQLNSSIEDLSGLLKEGETLLETIEWGLLSYNLVTVQRSTLWFESIIPVLKKFWEDVAAAKVGTFDLPPSKRKQQVVFCLIQDDVEPSLIDAQNQVVVGS